MLPHAISCTKSKLHSPPDRQSVNLIPFVKKPHYTPPRTHWMRPNSGFYEKRWDQRILVFASNNLFNQVHETGYSRGTCISNGTTLTQGLVSTCRNQDPYRTRCFLSEWRLNTFCINIRSTFVIEVPNAICSFTFLHSRVFFFFFLITNTILTIQYETPLTLIAMLIYITLLTVTNNYTTYSIQRY